MESIWIDKDYKYESKHQFRNITHEEIENHIGLEKISEVSTLRIFYSTKTCSHDRSLSMGPERSASHPRIPHPKELSIHDWEEPREANYKSVVSFLCSSFFKPSRKSKIVEVLRKSSFLN